MTKNEIKTGDIVRFTGDYHHYAESALEVGKEYTVVSADEYGCDLSVQCTAYSVDSEDLELVEPLDRKPAFLTELRELLKSHNATIQSYMSGVDAVGLCIYFGDENIEEVDYQHNDTICEIDADNIMDFDKE